MNGKLNHLKLNHNHPPSTIYLYDQRKVVDFDTQICGILSLVENPNKLHEVRHVDSFVSLSVHELDEVRQQFDRRQFKYRLVLRNLQVTRLGMLLVRDAG